MKVSSLLPWLFLLAVASPSANTSVPDDFQVAQSQTKPANTAPEKSTAPEPAAAEQKFTISKIYFFGYQADGLDVEKIRSALPIHEGQELSRTDKFEAKIGITVENLTGRPPTDVASICCDAKGGLWLYIGLAGSSYTPLSYNPVPRGPARLSRAAVQLEEDLEAAISKAVAKGDSGEDDSTGCALFNNPEARAIQLSIRKYILKNEELVYKVLTTSADVAHRQAAADFLGCATQSKRQIDALTRASRDADEGVRNNATRALSVLAQSSGRLAQMIPAAAFIDMLNSGTWTDRNKGGAVLDELSATRDPKLLAQLRARALPGLIEMARWDAGHAFSITILGRIAGIDEKSLQKMIEQGDQEKIIAAAQKAK